MSGDKKRYSSKNANAVSSVIGNLMMIAVVFGFFTVMLLFMDTVTLPEGSPMAAIKATATDASTLNLLNTAGDSIRKDEIRIMIGDATYNGSYLIDGNSNGSWDPGESVVISGIDMKGKENVVVTDMNDIIAYAEIIPSSISSAYPKIVANFTVSSKVGIAPQQIRFYDSSTGNPSCWAWDLGDGETSSLKNPVHEYTSPGVYTVKLTAWNDFSGDTKVKTGEIVIASEYNDTVAYKLTPILESVTDNGDGTKTAVYGYDNPESKPVYVPLGDNNRFYPGLQYRGQPAYYLPGVHHNVFSVILDSSGYVWHLTGKTSASS